MYVAAEGERRAARKTNPGRRRTVLSAWSVVGKATLIGFDMIVGSVVLANGSTRLQLDIAKSSDLPFHILLSSELLGKTKVLRPFSLSSLTIFHSIYSTSDAL